MSCLMNCVCVCVFHIQTFKFFFNVWWSNRMHYKNRIVIIYLVQVPSEIFGGRAESFVELPDFTKVFPSLCMFDLFSRFLIGPSHVILFHPIFVLDHTILALMPVGSWLIGFIHSTFLHAVSEKVPCAHGSHGSAIYSYAASYSPVMGIPVRLDQSGAPVFWWYFNIWHSDF